MKKLILKCCLFFIITLVVLEGLVRVFHLAKDNPSRFLDEHNVEKWQPNQTGFSVTGNRKQNFSVYKINKAGFNSYREFNPSTSKFEVALVGDSFIEGFHQNYYESIGKKIEKKIPEIEVYEYGYSGYDYADQMHLIKEYKDQFDLIDLVVIRISFKNDLIRAEYKASNERLLLEKGVYKILKKSKLIVYAQSIGLFNPVKKFVRNILSLKGKKIVSITKTKKEIEQEKSLKLKKYIENFENLNTLYGFNKSKFIFLLDSEDTEPIFLQHLKNNDYKYLDFRASFNASQKNKILIYDKHWNDHGREIISKVITNYVKNDSL